MPIADIDTAGRKNLEAPSLRQVVIAAAPWLFAAAVALLALI